MKVYLRMYVSLPSDIKGLQCVPDIFKEQSDKIRSILPAVFFEKPVLKVFTKFLETHPQQSSYSAYLQALKLANMLNFVFLLISAGPQISAPSNKCCTSKCGAH